MKYDNKPIVDEKLFNLVEKIIDSLEPSPISESIPPSYENFLHLFVDSLVGIMIHIDQQGFYAHWKQKCMENVKPWSPCKVPLCTASCATRGRDHGGCAIAEYFGDLEI